MAEPAEKPLRLFFALWPDEATRQRLSGLAQTLRRQCGGRPTPPDNLHLTLVFLGPIGRAQLPAIRAVADTVRVPAFALRFCELGYWARNRIAWIAPGEPPRALFDLVSALEVGVAPLGVPREERPYLPHVTLLRQAHCRGAALPPADIPWTVADFVLVASTVCENGARYEALGRWRLGQ